jgi:hypothetical protein
MLKGIVVVEDFKVKICWGWRETNEKHIHFMIIPNETIHIWSIHKNKYNHFLLYS